MRNTALKTTMAAAAIMLMLTGCGSDEDANETTQITTTQTVTTQAETTQIETTQSGTKQSATTQTATTQAESSGQTTENMDTESQTTDDDAWKVEFEKSLMEDYGVAPDHYEYLGDDLYQVYVEIDGNVVPYVVVNSVTGDYHG